MVRILSVVALLSLSIFSQALLVETLFTPPGFAAVVGTSASTFAAVNGAEAATAAQLTPIVGTVITKVIKKRQVVTAAQGNIAYAKSLSVAAVAFANVNAALAALQALITVTESNFPILAAPIVAALNVLVAAILAQQAVIAAQINAAAAAAA